MSTLHTHEEWGEQLLMESHPIEMQLKDYVEQIVDIAVPRAVNGATEAINSTVRTMMAEHIASCPRDILFSQIQKLDDRVDKIEIRFAALIGLMVGSGVFGGTISGLLIHFLGG